MVRFLLRSWLPLRTSARQQEGVPVRAAKHAPDPQMATGTLNTDPNPLPAPQPPGLSALMTVMQGLQSPDLSGGAGACVRARGPSPPKTATSS